MSGRNRPPVPDPTPITASAQGGLKTGLTGDLYGRHRQTAQRAVVPDGLLRIAPLVAIPRLLRHLGQDPTAVLARADIDPRLLDDGEQTIPYASAGRLLAICAARTGCDHFGLMLGQSSGLESLGLVGRLVECAPDLATALRNLVSYLHLRDGGAIPTLSVGKHGVRLGYAVYRPEIEGTVQIYDLALAMGHNLLRALCGSSWRATEVFLARAQPSDTLPYRHLFGARLRFDAERSVLAFPTTWLATPLPGADRRRHWMLEERLARFSMTNGADLRDRVRRIIADLMLEGRSSLEAVADALVLHPRTLNRRLRAQGSSYRRLSEDCRKAIAHQLLRDTGVAISDIAAVLSYADVAAFTRAFRRWSGFPPGTWRSAQQQARSCPALQQSV